MESKSANYAQFFLRIALALSFLSATADRFGFWGKPGDSGVSWGNWQNFVNYSNTLNFFVPASVGEVLAIIATVLEIILALFLLLGFKTKFSAIISGLLLTAFALLMSISVGIKAPFDYSVWTGAAAYFLLSTFNNYKYSIDSLLKNR